MTNIYTLAHRVVAWLGEESNDSKHVLETLQYVGRATRSNEERPNHCCTRCHGAHLWRNDHAPSFDERTWNALLDFVERTWFYRLWCWQKIKLGGRQVLLQCGGDTIVWNDFWLAILCLHNKDSSPSMWFRERCRHIVFLKQGEVGSSLSMC